MLRPLPHPLLRPLLIAVALGCSPDGPTPTTLYLRSGLPPDPGRYPRTNPQQWDLGSFSLTPPSEPEYRACGDVVLFGSSLPDTIPEGASPQQIAAIDWDVWWRTGTQRSALVLRALGDPAPLATLHQATCESGPGDTLVDGGLSHAAARTEVRAGTEIALSELYVAVEGFDSQVRAWSCPSAPSRLTLHPTTPTTPRPEAPTTSGCEVPAPARQSAPLGPAPTPTRVLPSVLAANEVIEGEVVAVVGRVTAGASLRVEGATLVMTQGADGATPELVVPEHGSLVIRESGVVAADPALGFRITTGKTSRVVLDKSHFDHPGALSWDHRGRPNPDGVVLAGPDATVQDCTFRHGLTALTLSGPNARVQGGHFEANTTGIQVRGSGAHIAGLRSELDGLFVMVRDRATDLQIKNVQVDTPREAALRAGSGEGTILMEHVEILGAAQAGVAFSRPSAAERMTFSDVSIAACQNAVDVSGVVPPPPLPPGVAALPRPEDCPRRPGARDDLEPGDPRDAR
jgi:hypothetical protein